ncbi:MAG: hypothetical protein JRN24_01565 [Nitrososphaerota archaeon]|nr:hypothetical protein [Nitrososphaerota archaeon]
MKSRKRYVLIEADRDFMPDEIGRVTDFLSRGRPQLKVIRPKGNGSALICRTDVGGASWVREAIGEFLGPVKLRTTLTSGCVGKLKRRASAGGSR